ncbi:MAG: cation:proton antiporter [Myxococcota bacterium]|nr:cation:proton antiporter [Myxococcota bacterium]
MTETALLFELILLLALTAAGLALFERLRLPSIAGFLVVGALAGPGVLGLVSDPERVRVLAEIGVVFLLFEIGLELPFERLRELGRTALVAGGGQVLVTGAVVMSGSMILGLSPASALVLGGIVCMSSTALAMRMLSEEGQLDSPHGQLALAVLIFQDLSLVPFLLAIPFLADGSSPSAAELSFSALRTLLALGGVLFFVRFAVPRLLNRVAETRSPDLFSLLALLIVLGSAFLAEQVGLSLAVGAFLAGVAASASPYAHQLFSEVVPLRGIALGLFFTAVGMLFEPMAGIEFAPLIGLYLLATLVLKTGVVAAASVFGLGQSLRVGLLAGLVLAQTGEFSFVLAESAVRAGLLSPALYQVVLAGSILSLLASPFVMRAAPSIALRASRWRSEDPTSTWSEEERSILDDRVVIIGYGPAGQTLTRLLRSMDIPYAVLESNASAVRLARQHDDHVLLGDATRPTVLRRLAVSRARLVVVVISDPIATRSIVSRIRLVAPDTVVLARTRYVAEVDLLEARGASQVVAEEFEGSIELVARALEIFNTPSGAIARFTQALRDEGYEAIRSPAALPMDPWLLELLDEVGTEWIECPADLVQGQTLSQLAIRARTGCSILGIERQGLTHANPDAGFSLRPGDRLLVLGNKSNLTDLMALLKATPSTD